MVGVDEVGRGCLAGPLLVVAARATAKLPDNLADSKLLSHKQRREILNMLSNCCEFGEGWVRATEIDKLGLANALRLGLKRALKMLNVNPKDEIIYDGPINYAPISYKKVTCIIRADQTVPIVSAASIYAKVKRDSYMTRLRGKYPQYGFEHHVGYSTRRHRAAILEYGPIDRLHRMSFAPLRQMELHL